MEIMVFDIVDVLRRMTGQSLYSQCNLKVQTIQTEIQPNPLPKHMTTLDQVTITRLRHAKHLFSESLADT